MGGVGQRPAAAAHERGLRRVEDALAWAKSRHRGRVREAAEAAGGLLACALLSLRSLSRKDETQLPNELSYSLKCSFSQSVKAGALWD